MVENKGLNKKYNFAIIVASITVLGSLLAFFLIVKPLYVSAGQLTKEAKDKQTNLDNLNNKKSKLETLKAKQDELTADSQTVMAALPEGKDVGRLFIQFDELVKAAGGTVKSVQEGGAGVGTTSENIGVVKKVSYTVPVSLPNYFNFKDLLSKSESALRLVNIGSLGIKSSNGAIDANLTIETFTR